MGYTWGTALQAQVSLQKNKVLFSKGCLVSVSKSTTEDKRPYKNKKEISNGG